MRVRAINGAGWGPMSEAVPVQVGRSIVITGSREGRTVIVEGATTGLSGREVTPWVRFPGPGDYTAGEAVRVVAADGNFAWQRVIAKKTYVYFRAGEVRSNRVIVQPK